MLQLLWSRRKHQCPIKGLFPLRGQTAGIQPQNLDGGVCCL